MDQPLSTEDEEILADLRKLFPSADDDDPWAAFSARSAEGQQDDEGAYGEDVFGDIIQQATRQGIAKKKLALELGRLNLRDAPPPPQFVVNGLIPAGKPGVLAGFGGVSKTMLAIDLACRIAIGRPIFGCAVTEGCALLFLGEEDGPEIARRVGAITQHYTAAERETVQLRVLAFPLGGEDIRLTRLEHGNAVHTGLSDEFIRLAREQEKCRDVPVRLIVIDHARLAMGGDPNAADHVTALTRELQHIAAETGAAVLLLAHSPKSAHGKDGASAADVAGSSAFVDNNRFAFIMTTMPEQDAKKHGIPADTRHNYVRLDVVKNNYGPTGGSHWFMRQHVPTHHTAILEEVELVVPVKSPTPTRGLEGRLLTLIVKHSGRLTRTKVRDWFAGKDRELQASARDVMLALDTLIQRGDVLVTELTSEQRKARKLEPSAKQVLEVKPCA